MPQVSWSLLFVKSFLFLLCIQVSDAVPSVIEHADAASLNTTAPTKTLEKRPYNVNIARICDKLYGYPNFWDCDKALLAIPTPNAAEAVRQRRFKQPGADMASDMPNENLPLKWSYESCIIEIATLSIDETDRTWDSASWRSLRGVSRQINNHCVWGKGYGGMQRVGINGRLSSTVYSTTSTLAEGGGVEAVRVGIGRSATVDEMLDAISSMFIAGPDGLPRADLQGVTIQEVDEPSAPPIEMCAARYCVPGMGGDCCHGWGCVWKNAVDGMGAVGKGLDFMLGKGLGGLAEVGWCSEVI